MSASSASTLLCKVYLPDNEIRRLKISRSQASFANLKSLVLNYYNDAIPTGQFARLKYKDEEGEWVLADSDAELLDAFQENSIKIQLYFSSKQEAPQSIQLQPIPETYSKAPQIPHSPSGSSSSAFLPSPPITIPKQPMHAPTPFSSPQNIAPRIAPSFVPSPAQQQLSPFIPMQPQRPMSVPVPATGVASPVPVRHLPPATPPPASGGATSIPSMLPSPSPRPSPSPAPVLAPSPSPSPRPPAQQPSFLSKPKAIHVGYKCDSCGKLPIEGTRFTCKTCENYDLCEYCHRYRVNFHDASHQFIAHEQDEKEQPKTNNIFNPQQSIHQSLQLSNPNVQQQLQQQQQAASKRKQYEAQLKQLDEMGLLADEMKCLQLLDQHKGNVAPVIENLVSQM